MGENNCLRFVIRLIGVIWAVTILAAPISTFADHGGSGHIDMGLATQSIGPNSYNVTWNHTGYGSYTYYLQESINDGTYSAISASR